MPGLVLRDEHESERFIPDVLPWVHEAGNPYYDWMFGGTEPARPVIARWMSRPSSEIAVRRVLLWFEDERPVGGFIGMDGRTLASCRKADLMATVRMFSGEDRAACVRRLSSARAVFAPVGPDDFYLSKLGVLGEYRRRQHGRRLLQGFLSTGEHEGYSRFRLDVAADNKAAISLYESAGFDVVAEASGAPDEIAYVAMRLDTASP